MDSKEIGADSPHQTTSKQKFDDPVIPEPIQVFGKNQESLYPLIISLTLNSFPQRVEMTKSTKKDKNKEYWKQVHECEKLFGKSTEAPECKDTYLRKDLWRNNFFRGFSSQNPFTIEIGEWVPTCTQLQGTDSPDLTPVQVNCCVQFLDSIKQLRLLLQNFKESAEHAVAFDLEFHNRNVYGKSITSTLQLSFGNMNLVIDCLNGDSRQGVRHGIHKILEDNTVIKIGCGIREDVKALQKDFGIYIHPVIDLQLAFYLWEKLNQIRCVVCEEELCSGTNECRTPSMEKIVKYFYPHLYISKLPQKADWSLRPLPNDLIVYASLDTSIVLKIWNHIKPTFGLSERNFQAFNMEVVRQCKDIALAQFKWDQNECHKKWMRKQNINHHDQQLLENMFIARDWFCRKHNKDVDKFLSNENCAKLLSAYTKGDSEFQKLLKSFVGQRSEDFQITLLDVMRGMSPAIPDVVVNNTIECSRCHGFGHTMGQCALPRIRNDDDKNRNKIRYRKKRVLHVNQH